MKLEHEWGAERQRTREKSPTVKCHRNDIASQWDKSIDDLGSQMSS
jgi:hypothetical protein